MKMMTSSKLSQHNQFPTRSANQSPSHLKSSNSIRLLKAVYGLVNAPGRWYHRVTTDLRNMRGKESVMEPCLWTFPDENSVCPELGLRRRLHVGVQ